MAIKYELDDFNFNLPKDLIATQPINPRDDSNLMYVGPNVKEGKKEFSTYKFNQLLELLQPNDLLIFNESKVIPAAISATLLAPDLDELNNSKQRVQSKSENIQIKFNLIQCIESDDKKQVWLILAKPSKYLYDKALLYISDEFVGHVQNSNCDPKSSADSIIWSVSFDYSADRFYQLLQNFGQMPLPPYIKRQVTEEDSNNYQTVYAKNPGSVAAPTAGLHFTEDLLKKLQQNNIRMEFITLHVGGGTFLPIRTTNLEEHVMHSENVYIPKSVCDAIVHTIKTKGRVIAVGTTTLRALESVADDIIINRNDRGITKSTNIFIKPPYNFKIANCLITNFHLPKSTLFILVCAFAGYNTMQQVYNNAIKMKWRFFSYGDACFLERSKDQQNFSTDL